MNFALDVCLSQQPLWAIRVRSGFLATPVPHCTSTFVPLKLVQTTSDQMSQDFQYTRWLFVSWGDILPLSESAEVPIMTSLWPQWQAVSSRCPGWKEDPAPILLGICLALVLRDKPAVRLWAVIQREGTEGREGSPWSPRSCWQLHCVGSAAGPPQTNFQMVAAWLVPSSPCEEGSWALSIFLGCLNQGNKCLHLWTVVVYNVWSGTNRLLIWEQRLKGQWSVPCLQGAPVLSEHASGRHRWQAGREPQHQRFLRKCPNQISSQVWVFAPLYYSAFECKFE